MIEEAEEVAEIEEVAEAEEVLLVTVEDARWAQLCFAIKLSQVSRLTLRAVSREISRSSGKPQCPWLEFLPHPLKATSSCGVPIFAGLRARRSTAACSTSRSLSRTTIQ